MSLFITFEGGEGCGKSYQSKKLFQRLKKLNIPAVLTYEPGGTRVGNSIRRLLKSNSQSISAYTELLLFNASRAELVHEVIIPSLERGINVVCDRFTDSTTVYQGYGRGLEIDLIKKINKTATGNIKPDLTILLDIEPAKGLGRKINRYSDRFESEDFLFHKKVRDGFLKLSAEDPVRWFTVDAERSRKDISDVIWGKVSSLLEK